MTLPNTVQLAQWETPATIYPRATVGKATIKTTKYKRGVYPCYRQGANGEHWDYFQVTKPLLVTTLKIGNKVWMVDDPPHYWAMIQHARHYNFDGHQGHVLVAGLGLGLIAHTLYQQPMVKHITIVERDPDVIALMQPNLENEIFKHFFTIVQADFHDYKPPEPPDGVFYDLFVGTVTPAMQAEALATFFQLKRQYGNIPVRIHGFNNEALQQLWNQQHP